MTGTVIERTPRKARPAPRSFTLGRAPVALTRTRRPRRPIGQQLKRLARTPKGILLLVFSLLGVAAVPAAGVLRSVPHVLLSVAAACLVDAVLVWWRRRTWRFSSGALLTGLIVAYVLSPDEPRYVPVVAGALAAASKHVVRSRHAYLFNPAGLALLAMAVVLGSGESWWGALADVPWPWILALAVVGALVVDRLNKFPLALSFLGTCFAGFTLVSFVNPTAVAEMFRDPFLQAAIFCACFMLTDPPTSPGPIHSQVEVGVVAGVVACLAQLLGAGQWYLLAGLLAGNFTLACRMAWYHHPLEPVERLG